MFAEVIEFRCALAEAVIPLLRLWHFPVFLRTVVSTRGSEPKIVGPVRVARKKHVAVEKHSISS